MEKKINIAFVILHYQVEDTTKKSVQYIKDNIDTDKYHIIIVDNASPNASGASLARTYQEDSLITVLCNKINLGFAKGNNVGFAYAKEKLNTQFIVLMNNDVYLLEKQFYGKTLNLYEESNFAVMGPKISTPNGSMDTNPFGIAHIPNEKYMRELAKEFKKRFHLEKFYLKSVYKLYQKILNHSLYRIVKKPTHLELEEDITQNVILHGCFLVFSKVYIDLLNGLDDRTFFYMEEELLHLHMYIHNLKMVYCPDIMIYHEEDVSTNAVIKTNRKKEMFCYKNQIESIKIWLETYNTYLG